MPFLPPPSSLQVRHLLLLAWHLLLLASCLLRGGVKICKRTAKSSDPSRLLVCVGPGRRIHRADVELSLPKWRVDGDLLLHNAIGDGGWVGVWAAICLATENHILYVGICWMASFAIPTQLHLWSIMILQNIAKLDRSFRRSCIHPWLPRR